MTTEMKQLLALLLLGCVFAVHGGVEDHKKMDPCSQGIAAIQVFMGYQGCADPNPFTTVRSLFRAFTSNVTVQNMNNMLTNVCSTAFPRIKQCFQRNIQNCSRDQRNSLMQVVQETGFVCEPNTSSVHHVIAHMLAKLTDSDLVESEACSRQNMSLLQPFCLGRTLEAIGLNPANMLDVLIGLSMEELVPIIQIFTRKMIECVVNQVHTRLSSCPDWRGKALRSLDILILPPLLGKSMPFTTEEIDQLFQWRSGGQTQMENLEQSLFSLFK